MNRAGDLIAAGFDRPGAGVGMFSFRKGKRVLAPHKDVDPFVPERAAISPDGTRVAVARRGRGGAANTLELRLYEIDPGKD
jgi:hypothetical protein